MMIDWRGRLSDGSRQLPVTKCSKRELAMSDNEQATDTREEELLKIFEGLNGRKPDSDQELKDWLASPEGQVATAFGPSPASRWGAVGRS